MNIFITGGTGLIGRCLANSLLSSHNITVLSRNITKAKKLLPDSVTFISSLNDIDFNNVDVVINLAGEPIANKRWTTAQKQEICNSRLQLTKQLSRLILNAETPPHTYISGSSVGYYGQQQNQFIDESYRDVHDEFTHQLCQQWEQLAAQAQTDNTRVCLLRTGIVLSETGGALSKMLPAFKLGIGGQLGDGKQFMSWIYIDDMVDAINHIIHCNDISGAINLVSPSPVTNHVFSKQLAQALHRPSFCTMPAFVLKLLFGEMSTILLNGQRVIPQKLLDTGFTFTYPNLQHALQAMFSKKPLKHSTIKQ